MRAGSGLINMEFIQFHPTGMVWPPSVKGILVTEGVRGDGGVLKNSEASGSCSTTSRGVQGAVRETEAEGRPVAPGQRLGTPHARPAAPRRGGPRHQPEVKAGRGTARRRLPRHRLADDAEEIRKRLPSMYHQFMELAEVDITRDEMEVGPTCHYVMGGIEVDPDTGARHPGLFAAGECSGGCTAPTGSAATR